MHLFLSAEESEAFLGAELRKICPPGSVETLAPGLLAASFPWPAENPPLFVFARQALPEARACLAASIKAWAAALLEAVGAAPGSAPPLAEDQPWQLHIVPHYGVGPAGRQRCQWIREALVEALRRKRRRLLRSLRPEPAPFTPADALVQLLLTGPDTGFLSVAAAPWPHHLRRVLSPFPKGEIPVASDQAAPCRAFAKLVEAERRLGHRIAPGETCVDLGASPGSWSYVALQRGARVWAVDRAPLRADLMRHPNLVFQQGDAFSFLPETLVDWLLCDVIAAPQRSIELVLEWVRRRRARHFVVTIKFKGHAEYGQLDSLQQALPELCAEFGLTRLCANKNEACVFGTIRPPAQPA